VEWAKAILKFVGVWLSVIILFAGLFVVAMGCYLASID
jgi:hypothetical protein